MGKRNVNIREMNAKQSNKSIQTTNAQRHVQIVDDYNPFPDADELEKLKRIDPNLITIIFNNVTAEQAFRHAQLDKQTNVLVEDSKTNNSLRRTGMWFAFIIFFSTMLLSTFLIFNDKPITGSIFFGATLLAAIGLFLRDQVTVKKEEI
jgi:uncharacterized membrane protein